MVNPNIVVPKWTGHRHVHTNNLWDGAKWPASYVFGDYPTTIRAILPVLATRVLGGTASDSERSQLREMRVWDPAEGGKVLLPSPHHCAQWLGLPVGQATNMLGVDQRCQTVIDDLQCESTEHWNQMTPDLRPPSDRLSLCRVKHWCKPCAKKISILGNGWHVTAASHLVASILEMAVLGKQGNKSVEYLDYSKQGTHECTNGCRLKMRLGDVRKKIKERAAKPAAPKDDGIIDV